MTQTPEAMLVMDDEEIVEANRKLRSMSAIAIVEWASERFGQSVRADTSFGMDSALIWDVVAAAGVEIGFTFGDTRLLAPQTYEQRDALVGRYDMDLAVAQPSDAALASVTDRRLWRSTRRADLNEFLEVVKLGPLRELDRGLGKLATIGAARRDQTLDREGLDYVTRSKDGTVRIYPFLWWPQDEVDEYIDSRGLPRNSLPQLYGPGAISHRNIVYFDGRLEVVDFDSCGRNSPDGMPVHGT